MDRLGFDLRTAWRSIAARPAASLATVLVLALGIGLVSAIFALADPFVLRPLPYTEPSRLVTISLWVAPNARNPALPTLTDWKARTELFAGVASFEIDPPAGIALGDGNVGMQTASVSGDFFATLGVAAGMSANWVRSRRDAEQPLVLTADAPARLLQPDALGRGLTFQDGRTARIIGGLPPSFVFPHAASARSLGGLMPIGDDSLVSVREVAGRVVSSKSRGVIARLRPGVTERQVQAALSTGGMRVTAKSLSDAMSERMRPLALGALIAAGLLLLVCAINASSLLLTRVVYRQRELSARYALGATGWDVSRMLLAEIALLALLGATAGLAVAFAVLATASGVMPSEFMMLGAPSITGRVVICALLSAAVAVGISLTPVWMASHASGHALLGRAQNGETRPVRVFRFGLVTAQSAVALCLLCGAALLGRSFVNLVSQDVGFNPSSLVVSVSYPEATKGPELQKRIEATVDGLRRVPGVTGVAAAVGSMLDGMRAAGAIVVRGVVVPVERKYVTPDYFRTAGSSIVAGRGFTAADPASSTCVVNTAFVREHSSGRSPVGSTLRSGTRVLEIVGVVADSHDIALDEPPVATVFTRLEAPTTGWRVSFILAGDLRHAAPGVLERTISGADPGAFLLEHNAIRGRLLQSIRDRSFAAIVLVLFAAAALGICLAGLVGVVTHTVARRTREIAIRVAVGATPPVVRRLVMREAVLAAAAGCVIGTAASLALSQTLRHLLYGISATDPLSFAAAASLSIGAAIVAAWLPARRATKIAPVAALRAD